MPQVMEQTDSFAADFQRVAARAAAGPWAFFSDRRRRAFARFAEMGFPTTKMEEWRFTNVQPIAKTAFQLAENTGSEVTADTLASLAFGGVSSARIVFVDGRYRPDLSILRSLPKGVAVTGLAAALTGEHADLVREHLGRYADESADAFTALNTAFVEDGAFIHIGRNLKIDAPIHMLFFATDADRPLASHPRNLIIAEHGSHATVIENYVSHSQNVYFSNAVTEACVGPNAELHHYLLERESEASFNIATLRADQDRDSRFESHSVLLGGAIARNNIHLELVGENAYAMINGLYLPHRDQHMDNHMRVVHAAPNCGSRQFYRGILDDHAKAVFSGRIVVNEGAQKTDAVQHNSNLLLSNDAQIDTKPQLEIYADDVKCTHGATTGQIDEDALFYLQARGLSEEAARGMLIYAFAHESIDRMDIEAIRRPLEKLLVTRLPQMSLMDNLL
ncbi:MAG: Fe-S cluster assembly protein SufD [Planctomycetes bacterium]|nr:Fe-S cluster assembly protein SufD [Planctomycetota bacterium]